MKKLDALFGLAVQPHALLHFLTFPSFAFFLRLPRRAILLVAGDLTQWHLSVGMKDLNLAGCNELTGTARLKSDGQKEKVPEII